MKRKGSVFTLHDVRVCLLLWVCVLLSVSVESVELKILIPYNYVIFKLYNIYFEDIMFEIKKRKETHNSHKKQNTQFKLIKIAECKSLCVCKINVC